MEHSRLTNFNVVYERFRHRFEKLMTFESNESFGSIGANLESLPTHYQAVYLPTTVLQQAKCSSTITYWLSTTTRIYS